MVEKVRMSKNFLNKNRFEVARIEDEEESKIQEELRQKNIAIMKECIEDAKLLLGKSYPRNIYTLAVALFEQRATKSFTLYLAFLDEKVRQIRNSKEIRILKR